ncbi:enoyl-CoA hydratase/isomerase family protein [Chloroflexota bacterium]
MAEKTVLIEKEAEVGIITLNRPERLNALNQALTTELGQAITQLEHDETVKAIIVTGAGEKAFSAGADIHEIVQLSQFQDRKRNLQRTDWVWQLAACRKPTIGVINGLAYGGGALIASTFDIRLGCERTTFRFLGAKYGRVNATWTLPLIVGWPMAKELLFTGRIVEAEEANRIGLLNRLVPSQELMKAALEMAQAIAANDVKAVQGTKEIMTQDIGLGWHEMLSNESETVARLLGEWSPRESFKDFLEKRG